MSFPHVQIPYAAEQAMTTLSAKWYNSLVADAGLSRSEFQLVQGHSAIGTTSESLWKVLDQIPPAEVCRRHDPANVRNFAQGYSDLFETISAEGAQRFMEGMGDFYALWESDKVNLDPIPSTGLEWMKEFVEWACVNLPMALTQKCINLYKTALLDPVFLASHMLAKLKHAPRKAGVSAYTLTSSKLWKQLDKAAPRSVMLNSSDTPSCLGGSWSDAQEAGIFNVFGCQGSGDHVAPTLKIANAGVSIRCTFEKLVSVRARPLERASYDPELKDYTPWFSPSALQGTYESWLKSNWNSKGTAHLERSFGPDGNLQRFCVGLVIVDGIKLTLTSKAGLSVDEQTEFSRQASSGLFPFYKRSGAGGWFTDWIFDERGNVTVSTSCKPGNPQLLGVLVKGLSSMLG